MQTHLYPTPIVVVPAASAYLHQYCVALPRGQRVTHPVRPCEIIVSNSTHLLVCSFRRIGDWSARMHTPPGARCCAGSQCRTASPCGAASRTYDPSLSQKCHGVRRGSYMPGAVSLHAWRPQSLRSSLPASGRAGIGASGRLLRFAHCAPVHPAT